MELPPRARRIQIIIRKQGDYRGTTSACAENTRLRRRRLLEWLNYLRVRGEYIENDVDYYQRAELPPRARRIHIKSRQGP